MPSLSVVCGLGHQCAKHLCMGTTCTAADTILVIRCPHCMAGIEFRPMITYKYGRFVCRDCAHTVWPGLPEYRCTCRPCLRAARGDDAEERRNRLLTGCGKRVLRCAQLAFRWLLGGIVIEFAALNVVENGVAVQFTHTAAAEHRA